MLYEVEVYEPAVDPGGYWDIFKVDAESDQEAANLAMQEAKQKWPDNKGLMVSKITWTMAK